MFPLRKSLRVMLLDELMRERFGSMTMAQYDRERNRLHSIEVLMNEIARCYRRIPKRYGKPARTAPKARRRAA